MEERVTITQIVNEKNVIKGLDIKVIRIRYDELSHFKNTTFYALEFAIKFIILEGNVKGMLLENEFPQFKGVNLICSESEVTTN